MSDHRCPNDRLHYEATNSDSEIDEDLSFVMNSIEQIGVPLRRTPTPDELQDMRDADMRLFFRENHYPAFENMNDGQRPHARRRTFNQTRRRHSNSDECNTLDECSDEEYSY
ncbi:hypothetical protein ACOME3_000119 [Neoechinorhynchus agilis]